MNVNEILVAHEAGFEGPRFQVATNPLKGGWVEGLIPYNTRKLNIHLPKRSLSNSLFS